MNGTSPRRCLGCNYVLEHLPEPRCPECGRKFDPDDPQTYRQTGRMEFPEHAFAWTMLAISASIASYVGVCVGQALLWSAPGLALSTAVVARSLAALVSSTTRLRWAWIVPLLISAVKIAVCGGALYVLGPFKDATAP